MTRILLIHQAFVSPSEAGGTRHYELAQYLIRRGYPVTIVASNLSYLTGQRTVEGRGLVTEQVLDGVRVLRAYTYPSLHKSFVWRVISFLSFMVTAIWAGLRSGPIDLVMGTSPPIFQAFSAWVVAFWRRKPFLLEIRDLWPEFAIDMGVLKNPVLIQLSRGLERFLYARATHLVVNSPAYRDYLIAKGVSEAKISLIPNGVDVKMFDPAADGSAIRLELGLEGKYIITYAGALGLANDLTTVLRAAGELRDDPALHFLFVGDGKERARLEAQAQDQALPNVTFAGSRPKTAMPDLLAASDACLAILQDIPMFRTTYPNKVFDYMAAGRPTLLAIDGVIREVIEAAHGGIFVPPGDAGALAQAARDLSQDPQRGRQMGEAARAYVVEHFDRDQQAAQLISLVERWSTRRRRL
jgi:glycosyltransferase involved in cell wall biosynthesis